MENTKSVREHEITLSGRRMHFWKGGAGPALLLLHAAWGDAEMSWSSVWDELSRSYTVIAPDIPGFGRSSPVPKPALSVFANDLKELLNAVKLDRAAIAGNSFGAAVAIQFANDFPESVTHLVLVNGGYMPRMPGPVRKLATLPIVNRTFRWLVRRFTFSPRTLKRSFADPAGLPAGFFEKIQEKAIAYSNISFDTVMNMTEFLQRPAVPVFLVWGAQDGLAPLEQAQALLKSMPSSALIIIEGAGHMPQVERPREFAAAVRDMTTRTR